MSKPKVLVISDGAVSIRHCHHHWREFQSQFEVIVNDRHDRKGFIEGLKEGKWDGVVAITKPQFEHGKGLGRFDEGIISLLPKSVRIITGAGAGYDWIDVEVLAKKGIWYCNGGNGATEATSDIALMLILATFRLTSLSEKAARTGDPKEFVNANIRLLDITHNPRGHILGVVGAGQIGFQVARKAHLAFGMNIHYYDPVRLPSNREDEIRACHQRSLDDLLAIADCVVITTPYSEKTHHLIDANALSKMKQGGRLVNTSRGKVVDEKALIEALRSGHLFSVGLDVHHDEPKVAPELIAMDNVTLLTHMGGGTIETRAEFERLSLENITQVFFGTGKPLTPVNNPQVDD